MATSSNGLVLTGNTFFDSLPETARAAFLPLIEHRQVAKGYVVSGPSEPLVDIFFPVRSVISTVTVTEEGAAVEVGLTGHEGMSPLHAAFGSASSRHSTLVQIPGTAFCLSAKPFIAEFENNTAFRDRCLKFAEFAFASATQFAACNGVHPIDERYARWILMANDRVGSAEIELTQEYSAQMLGVRRATVTEIAQSLNRRGFINYRRGHITVTDRIGLEDSTCECYAAVNDDLQRLMGYGASKRDS